MKVSKLFHWLYALLMLLPAFFVGGRMAYTIFNKNAKDSYSGEYNSASSLVFNPTLTEAETYYLDNTRLSSNTAGYFFNRYFYSNARFVGSDYYDFSVTNNFRLYYRANGDLELISYLDNTLVYDINITNDNRLFSFDFVGIQSLTGTYSLASYSILYKYEYSDNYSLDNAFDYSMNQINELPLFSWAKDSFLVTPFSYIGNLFGLPSDSPIITLLSYWLSISIIYLVFDLIMYVPLLAHRWIDKGMIE